MLERLISVLLRLRQIIHPCSPATLIGQQAKSNQLLCYAKSQVKVKLVKSK